MDPQDQIDQLSQALAQAQLAAASKENELQKMLEQAMGEIRRLRRDVDTMQVTGDGFAGNGPHGISYVAPAAIGGGAGGGPTEGSWKSFNDCDGDTFDVWVRSFTPPA